MKSFLSITAIAEGATGLILIIAPTFIAPLLLSTPLEETGGIISARIAGIAITALALTCWFSKNDNHNSGIMKSLLFYNFAIVAMLIYASISYQLTSPILWLVVIAHAGLGLWGGLLLRKSLGKN